MIRQTPLDASKLFEQLADAMKDPGKVALMEAGMKISAAQAREVVHMIGDKPVKLEIDGPDVHTRCGKIGCPICTGPEPETAARYTLLDEKGNQFFGTTRRDLITCKKCTNLITVGRIHAAPKV